MNKDDYFDKMLNLLNGVDIYIEIETNPTKKSLDLFVSCYLDGRISRTSPKIPTSNYIQVMASYPELMISPRFINRAVRCGS